MIDAYRLLSICSCTRIALATAISLAAANTFAQTAADEWRAAGAAQSASKNSPAGSAAGTNWQLPNQQSPARTPAATSQNNRSAGIANPLRQQHTSQPSSAIPEPRALATPANAAPISRSQSSAIYNPPVRQQQSPSTAAARTPVNSGVQQASATSWQTPANAPRVQQNVPSQNYRTAYNQPTQAAHAAQVRNFQDRAPSLWDTINVTFEGEAAAPNTKSTRNADPENLPMPSPTKRMSSPMGHEHPMMMGGNDPFMDDGFQPYGGCECGEGGCPCGDCECGGCCEPGCGCGCGESCEPGCGCATGGPDDLFCIGPGDDESCHTVRLRWPKWQEVMVFGGVQGFKGPYDQDRDSGNFGFNEGFNIGAKIPYALAGYQFGYRGAQNQVNGDEAQDIEDQTFQQFATAGVFHRTTNGIQGGVVWDVLSDERFQQWGYHQIRSELSLMSCATHEFGASASFGLNEHNFDDGAGGEISFQASDQYLLFYRFHGPKGGEGRIYAGCNDDSDGIVGSDFLLPLGDRFSMQGGFTYLIPDAPGGAEGASEEAWNLSLGLVWHWHNRARACHENCYRPLFNVADNGYVILHEVDSTN